MKRTLALCFLVLAGILLIAQAQEITDDPVTLPALDSDSVKGLVIECQPIGPRFTEGKPVVVQCKVTNTTDSLKPFGWDTGQSPHYDFVQYDERGIEVLHIHPIPTASLRLEKPIMIKSKEWPMTARNRFVLYIPPNESIMMRVSFNEGNLGIIRGKIMYDPIPMRNVILPKEKLDQERVYSNEFEYEVVPDIDQS